MTTYALLSTPSNFTLSQILNDRSFTNLAGAVQAQGQTGNRWGLSLQFANVVATKRRILWGELARLAGIRNRLQFTLNASIGYAALGNLGGSPLLNGGIGAGATSLICDAFPNSTTVLKAGDFFSIGNELKIVTADVTSDGSGNAPIGIWPETHHNFPDNTAISYTPAGVFICQSPVDFEAGMFRANDWVSSIEMQFVEDVLA